MIVKLIRQFSGPEQTLGEMYLCYSTCVDYQCKTLELPWLDNKKMVSCIPRGIYPCRVRNSVKYGKHFHVMNVDGRSMILIHAGNYKSHTKGCILVGKTHTDIDGDGLRDVTNSRKTMNELLEKLPQSFNLEVC